MSTLPLTPILMGPLLLNPVFLNRLLLHGCLRTGRTWKRADQQT
jgi:hypothetical protein